METEKLLTQYIEWLNTDPLVNESSSYHEITTPFLDQFNDHYQFYFCRNEGNQFFLTDDGCLLSSFEYDKIDGDNDYRTEWLERTLQTFRLNREDDAITAECSLETLPETKHCFIQGLIRIEDQLDIDSKDSSAVFSEEIRNVLEERDIRYIEASWYAGQSGYTWEYDFVIPGCSKGNHTDSFCQAIGNPTKEKVELQLCAWKDVVQVRKRPSRLVLLLDDVNSSPETIEEIDRLCCAENTVGIIFWSQYQISDLFQVKTS